MEMCHLFIKFLSSKTDSDIYLYDNAF